MKDNISIEDAFLEIMKTESGRYLIFACYYDYDVLQACRRFHASEEWEAVSNILANTPILGNLALDLGAGNGIGSYALAQIGYQVTAVEPDASNLIGYGALLSMVKETALPIEHFDGVGEDLPFEDESFSLVYARQVLHHAKNLQKMMAEIARVLKPGGLFIACREHVIDNKSSLLSFLENHPVHQYAGNEGAFKLAEYIDAIKSKMTVKIILGPFDSVINHYPITNTQLKNKMKQYLRQQYGKLGAFLANIPVVEKRYRHHMSMIDRTPGRMYTFVAIR